MVDGGGTVVVVVADVVVVVAAVDGISALTVVSAPEGCSSAAVRSGTAVWKFRTVPLREAQAARTPSVPEAQSPQGPRRCPLSAHCLFFPFLQEEIPRFSQVKNSIIFGKKADYDKIVTAVYKVVNSAEKE